MLHQRGWLWLRPRRQSFTNRSPSWSASRRTFDETDVEKGAEALLRWQNPPHSMRQVCETDRQRARVVLSAVAKFRENELDHDSKEA